MPAIEQRGYINVDDIPIAQSPRIGNAMADHLIDRDAARMGIAAIAERRRDRPAVHGHLPDQIVNRRRGHSRRDHPRHRIEDFRRQPPGPAHAFKGIRPMQLDRAVAQHGI